MAFSIKKNLDKIDLMSNIRGTHQIIDSVGQHFQRKKELASKIHALSNVLGAPPSSQMFFNQIVLTHFLSMMTYNLYINSQHFESTSQHCALFTKEIFEGATPLEAVSCLQLDNVSEK